MTTLIRSPLDLRAAVAHLLSMSRAQEASEESSDFNRGHSAGRKYAYETTIILIDMLIQSRGDGS